MIDCCNKPDIQCAEGNKHVDYVANCTNCSAEVPRDQIPANLIQDMKDMREHYMAT